MNSGPGCNERNFEVFLSFKNSDADGQPTKECLMATRLYEALTKRGINTFFSNATLELLGAAKFKHVIDDALDQCDVLIAIGTSLENITSQWVKYEWDSFSNDILSGLKPNGALFSYIESMTPHMLPRTLRQSQVFESSSSSIDDICNYIENALAASRQKQKIPITTPVKTQSTSETAISLNDIYQVSKKYMKRSFAPLLADPSKLDEYTKNYSDLFSTVTYVKRNGEQVDHKADVIGTLLNAIMISTKENIVKLVGNNGSEKNAIMQLLFLHLYQDAINNGLYIPFYINLPYYEKQAYDTSEKIVEQIGKELSRDLQPFIDYTARHPNKKPVIFIDGIRDFIFSKTLIEHILAEKLSPICNLAKVVSVDTNLTINKVRQKKVIALAPTNFEFVAKVASVDLVDDEVCAAYFAAFKRIYGIDGVRLHDKMKKMAFYEIDAYILRLSSTILNDNLYNDAFTIGDLYEAMCLEMFNGNKEMLLCAAKTAYDFAYNEREFEDADVFSAKHWVVIKRHKSFVDFLISYYYIHKLTAHNDSWDVDFFEQVLPKEVTRFVTPRLNDSYANEEKIIKLVKKHYASMGILGKSEMTFWLGRLRNQKLATEAKLLLKKLYDDLNIEISQKKKNNCYTSISEQKADLFLLRGITVSLIYCGFDKVSEDYINSMIDDDLPNMINRGFHLEYYGDKRYIPNKDMLDFEDDIRIGERTLKRLVKNIEQHLSRNVGAPILELDLFTMCSLLQPRIGSTGCKSGFNIYPYVTMCVDFLKAYQQRIKHVNNKKIFAYFHMIQSDFTQFLGHGEHISIPCSVYNTYSQVLDVKRTGWVELGIPAPESVGEHMYNSWLFAALNLPATLNVDGYDKSRILNMIMIHDLGESVTGDIPKPKKIRARTYDDTEDSIMRAFLLKGTYPEMTNLKEYYSLWEEWFDQKTFNSHVAKDVDLLQAMYQFCVYYKKYPEKFTDERRSSWLAEYRDLKTEIGYELYERIIKNNPAFKGIDF